MPFSIHNLTTAADSWCGTFATRAEAESSAATLSKAWPLNRYVVRTDRFNPAADVGSRYGAPMGRPSDPTGDMPATGRLYVTAMPLDSGGYDSGGAYWGRVASGNVTRGGAAIDYGTGQRIYCVHNRSGTFARYIRAASSADAAAGFPADRVKLPAAPARFDDLDEFARGYVEALFFTNGDTSDDDEFSLEALGVDRLTRASVASIASDCSRFQDSAAGLLALAYGHTAAREPESYDAAAAGRDLWFTRQGHGVGFWDRERLAVDVWQSPSGERYAGDMRDDSDTLQGSLGDLLTDATKAMGESYPQRHRGWIHV